MRKILLFCLVIFAAFAICGCSRKAKPVKVETAEEFMEAISSRKSIELMADIDLSEYPWRQVELFGEFSINGNGHTIKNIYYSAAEGDNIGLFKCGERTFTISNVNFENVTVMYYGTGSGIGTILGQWNDSGIGSYMYIKNTKISGRVYAPSATNVGGVIGAYLNGNVSSSGGHTPFDNIDVDVDVVGKDTVGGVVGKIGHSSYGILDAIMGKSGSISNMFVEMKNIKTRGDVEASSTHAGGLVGAIYATNGEITNCENYGSVKAVQNAGGIAGRLNIYSIKNSSNYGTITNLSSDSVKDHYIGGIAGIMQTRGESSALENNGEVTCSGNYAGGIAGYIAPNTPIHESTNKGKVSAASYAGGFAGGLGDNAKLIKCINSAEVLASEYVGGFCGIAVDSFISRCENQGAVQAANKVGGIVGYYRVSDTDSDGAVVSSVNSGSVTATNSNTGYAAGIIGLTDADEIEDIDTNTQSGTISGGKTNEIANYES